MSVQLRLATPQSALSSCLTRPVSRRVGSAVSVPARRLSCRHCAQGPNPEARKAVESKNPYVSAVRGHVRLDDDPDVKEVRRCGLLASPISPLGHPSKWRTRDQDLHR